MSESDVRAVWPESLAERAAELSSWCDLDPPAALDVRHSLIRDTDQLCLVGPKGAGAAVVVPRGGSAALKYLAVPPGRRHQGIGTALLAECELWARDNGYGNLFTGLAAPGYLWPGVEMGLTTMETFLMGRGYRVAVWAVNQLVELPCDLPVGQARPARPDELELVTSFCREYYGAWEIEARWSFDEPAPHCAVWVEEGELLGFACWSVTREGWFGPMATRPDLRHGRSAKRVGTGILAVALAALAAVGRTSAEISWVEPELFYAKVVGARTHRAFRVFQKQLPPPA